MNGTTNEVTSRRRVAGLLAGLLLATAVAPYVESHAAPTGSDGRYAGMPSPAAFDPVYNSLGTTMVIRGERTIYRFDSAGQISQRRRHLFSFTERFSTSGRLRTFGSQKYLQLTSGRFDGWWVAAPQSAPANVVNYATARQVRLNSGIRAGVRFYAGEGVRTRLLVELSEADTVEVTRRGSFAGRTFYLVSSGPLAGRWVAARHATLIPRAGSTQTASVEAPPLATWKALALVYRETDVTFQRSDGTNVRIKARMTDSMHGLVLDTLDRTRRSVAGWSNGMAAMTLDVVNVPHPITSLDAFGDGYWVGPRSIQADLDSYAPPGRYDSVFVVWLPKDSAGQSVPVGGWGLTLPPGSWSNGAGYSSVITPAEDWWWTASSAPQEVFVHEWLHQVIYFHDQAGRLQFDLHAGGSFGYEAVDGSWKLWLSDVMQGKVRDGDRYRGITAELWAAGTPRGN